jgi:hypothetical protein
MRSERGSFKEVKLSMEGSMVLPHERNPSAFGPWHSAATLASAIVVLGLVMTWPVQRPPALPSERQPASEPCTSGDEVSDFVCRNGWVADLAHNYR